MSNHQATLNVETLKHADETYRQSIQYLLLRSLALPSTIPAHEATQLKVQLQDMIRLVIDDLERYLPDLRAQLIDDMRDLGDMVIQVVRAYDEPTFLRITDHDADVSLANLTRWSQSLRQN